MPKKTDFYRLSRPVQDRFAAATRRAAPPAPLLFEAAPRTRVWAFLGAGGGLIVGAIAFLEIRWGNLARGPPIPKGGVLRVGRGLFRAPPYLGPAAVAPPRPLGD